MSAIDFGITVGEQARLYDSGRSAAASYLTLHEPPKNVSLLPSKTSDTDPVATR